MEYLNPIDSPIVLAGNFGEPRPWHFHGGLDIKTQNREGWRVKSVADGYVSRLTVNLYGFGNAIYVTHPDGNTSVYCHLKRFAEQYEQQLQRTGRGDTLSVTFAPGQFPVRGGELIALSGNTGHSTGPHLHLEIHDTESWAMRDPMALLGHLIADSVAPQAHSFMAVPVAGRGVFNGSGAKQTFGFGQPETKRQRTTWTIDRGFTAWGRVGFALWADDYSEATYHHYGVRHTRLLVDGREVFRADVDSIPISCQPEVNRWGDYDHWRRTRRWYMKSYREEGVRLPILHTDFRGGYVVFDEERQYRLTYILRDFQNNESRYDILVRGQRDRRVDDGAASGSAASGDASSSGQPLWTGHPAGGYRLLDRYRLWQQCLWPRHEWRW